MSKNVPLNNSETKTIRTVLWKKVHPDAKIPTKGSSLSAGYDLYALEDGSIKARERVLIKTGLSVQLPNCPEKDMVWVLKIEPRSSLSWKKGLETGAGVIDADYRGPIGVVMFNHTDQDVSYSKGDKIAQCLLYKVANFACQEVQILSETQRGQGGFGSTGK